MKYATASIALAVAALLTGHAQAADNLGKTREQVRAELAEAQRTGDIQAGKDAGLDEYSSGAFKKVNELNPAAYPAQAATTGKTRAQVLAELADAQRTGDILAGKDTGFDEYNSGGFKKLNVLNPSLYASNGDAPSKTRVQVQAELSEAQRTGDIVLAVGSGNFIRLNSFNDTSVN